MIGEIKNSQGERLDYDWVVGSGDDSLNVVVIGHGVTANKERPWALALSSALQAEGITSLRLSFSGNGASHGRFEESTISKEIEDLGAVLDKLGRRQIVYVGHSMGGAVGVLRAARDDRIRALVSLAGMVHTHAFAQRKFGDQEPGDSLMWEKPDCPLSQDFMDDMAAVGSVVEQAATIEVPWLLVHGTADEVVPIQDSIDVRAAASGRPELVELEGVDHVFSDAGESAMVAVTVPWISRFLAGDGVAR